MSDHQTSYKLNAMLVRLYFKNKAFQSLNFEGQQSLVLDVIETFSKSDVNLGEILSNEYYVKGLPPEEHKSLSTIFQICCGCGKAKENVEDYYSQGFCYDCAREIFSEDEFAAIFSKKETQN